MSDSRDALVNPRRRLPHAARAGGRRSTVLVMAHAGPCGACEAFVRRLAEAADTLRDWDAEVAVTAPGDAPPASPVPRVADDEGLAAALGVRAPAVVIADPWGEVHAALDAGDAHAFPAVGEIESWARYLAIQCPECEGEAL